MIRAEQGEKPKGIEVIIGPHNRAEELAKQLRMDALDGLQENPFSAYCAIALTNTPELVKPFVRKGQDRIKGLLERASITAYDPGTAPLSPDLNLTEGPGVIYQTDLARVASSRFFTADDTIPSTGKGVETAEARRYNRISVIFHDNRIRTSRMQPDCTIHVGITDWDQQENRIVEMFQMLKTFEPGRGLVDGQPALLGFKDDEVVDLAKEVNETFPDLAYTFDGTKPPLKFALENHAVLFDTSEE